MRWWAFLAIAGAAGLVLILALAFRDRSEPVRRADGQPSTETPDNPASHVASTGAPVTSPAEQEEDERRTKRVPETERWYYDEFLRRAAADPAGFDRLADEKIRSSAPLEERIALLRAAWKVRGKDALPWFSEAFARGAGSREADEDTLRAFVVRHLARYAQSTTDVSNFLWEKVFLDGAVNVRDRTVAGRAVLQGADPAGISRLIAALPGISDAGAVDGALVGLGLNEHAEAAAALSWLSSSHPDERVRERAAEVARQRLTGDVGKEDSD